MFGLLTHHVSTVRPLTEITAERGADGRCRVVVRYAGVETLVWHEPTEARCRERFERLVTAHETGEPV